MRFDEGQGATGRPLTLDEMETAYDRRWPFRAPATILVQREGGFPEGEHALALLQQLRVSYLPCRGRAARAGTPPFFLRLPLWLRPGEAA